MKNLSRVTIIALGFLLLQSCGQGSELNLSFSDFTGAVLYSLLILKKAFEFVAFIVFTPAILYLIVRRGERIFLFFATLLFMYVLYGSATVGLAVVFLFSLFGLFVQTAGILLAGNIVAGLSLLALICAVRVVTGKFPVEEPKYDPLATIPMPPVPMFFDRTSKKSSEPALRKQQRFSGLMAFVKQKKRGQTTDSKTNQN